MTKADNDNEQFLFTTLSAATERALAKLRRDPGKDQRPQTNGNENNTGETAEAKADGEIAAVRIRF